MDTENKVILKELADNFPGLKNVARENVYRVPEGYFLLLANSILEGLNESESAFAIPLDSPYSLNPGYFQELPGKILSIIKQQQESELENESELAAISPHLSGKKKNPYMVPDGYFETLIVSNIPVVAKSGKGLRLFKRFALAKYAAAAVLTGLLATGIVFLNEEKSVVSITENEYKLPTTPFNPKDIQSLTEEEISDFLKTHSSSQSSSTTPNIMLNNKPVENNIQSISDQEIQEYLKNNPEPGEHTLNS